MADKQTACIARLYGEHRANGFDYDMYPDPHSHWDSTATGFAKQAAPVIEWLTERYCLVEKSTIKETWKEITNVYLAHQHITYDGARYLFDEVLFPEIAKEVEDEKS